MLLIYVNELSILPFICPLGSLVVFSVLPCCCPPAVVLYEPHTSMRHGSKHTHRCHRLLKIVGEAPTQADAEETMGRQYEELMVDVEKERVLVNAMAQWQPWVAPQGHVPKMFAELKDIPANVKAFRDFQHEMGTQ